ncbi:restriction endonuclease subunit S [Rubritalea tangerina]|uniref:Restriction endonuclease subunit S n=2 Tax=Rubritalea tangerina TaxID=430798 RepID=A0ABW4Z940_9BACT
MRTKNVQKVLDQSDLIAIPSSVVKNKNKYLKSEDILVSSANSWNLVGKCCWVPELEYDAVAGGFISILRGKDSVDSRFLYHWFNSPRTQTTVRSFGNQTTNISNLDHKRTLKLEIPLPPLAEQKRISAILDAADALRQQRRKSIDLLDQLIQSTFLHLFGDPVTNPKGWEHCSLKEYGVFKNGLNFGKGESGYNLYSIGVGDFKNHTNISGVTALSEISLNKPPSDDYLLENGDLLLVRSNGNKALVGRCLSVTPDTHKVSYSGFCIRYRIESHELTSSYLVHLFRCKSFREYMLSGGRGANIQNINQQILNSLDIPLPPLALQQEFANTVEKIEAQKSRYRTQLAELDTLFLSLQSRAFKGEL